jgi:hypothetical protein
MKKIEKFIIDRLFQIFAAFSIFLASLNRLWHLELLKSLSAVCILKTKRNRLVDPLN